MSKSSIHIKPCNIAQSEAHNRRDKKYLKSLNPDQIYIDTFLGKDRQGYAGERCRVYGQEWQKACP